jgi:hypothetical protein
MAIGWRIVSCVFVNHVVKKNVALRLLKGALYAAFKEDLAYLRAFIKSLCFCKANELFTGNLFTNN